MWQRHQLVVLGPEGWRQALDAAWDAQALECLALWQARRLPLVVTRQRQAGRLALGLPAPLQFDRRRLAIEVAHDSVSRQEAFPPARYARASVAAAAQAALAALCEQLQGLGCAARVYGAHGWQLITGLGHVHAQSDLDLLLPVAGQQAADAVCAALAGAAAPLPRVDGELIFPDGDCIAWREWRQWRQGQVAQVLVKRLDGVRLACPAALAC